jgi:DNA-binding CsgD family transcriptional regulator
VSYLEARPCPPVVSQQQISSHRKLELDHVHQLIRLLAETGNRPARHLQRGQHLLSGLARIVSATAGVAVLVAGDPQRRGGPCAEQILVGWDGSVRSSPAGLSQLASWLVPVIRTLWRVTPGEPGATITATWREYVADRARYGAEPMEPCPLPTGLTDALLSSVRLSVPYQLQGLGLYRSRERPPFSEEERNLVHVFQAECVGLSCASPRAEEEVQGRARLSPRQRQTLELILSGLCDKEIAERLGISRYTVNQYTKVIYRVYAVTSRAQLIARLIAPAQPAHSLILGA